MRDVQAIEVALALCRVSLVDQRAHRGASGRPSELPIEAQIPQRIQTLRSGQRISIRCHSLEAASVTSDRYGQISY